MFSWYAAVTRVVKIFKPREMFDEIETESLTWKLFESRAHSIPNIVNCNEWNSTHLFLTPTQPHVSHIYPASLST